jgi:hypothetical protein
MSRDPGPRTKKQSEMQAVMLAFLESRQMDHLKSCRERGRIFESLTDQQLETQYLDAHNAFLGGNDHSRSRECDDLTSEYAMRDKAPPTESLTEALDKAGERLKNFDASKVKSGTDDLVEFLENYLGKPKN